MNKIKLLIMLALSASAINAKNLPVKFSINASTGYAINKISTKDFKNAGLEEFGVKDLKYNTSITTVSADAKYIHDFGKHRLEVGLGSDFILQYNVASNQNEALKKPEKPDDKFKVEDYYKQEKDFNKNFPEKMAKFEQKALILANIKLLIAQYLKNKDEVIKALKHIDEVEKIKKEYPNTSALKYKAALAGEDYYATKKTLNIARQNYNKIIDDYIKEHPEDKNAEKNAFAGYDDKDPNNPVNVMITATYANDAARIKYLDLTSKYFTVSLADKTLKEQTDIAKIGNQKNKIYLEDFEKMKEAYKKYGLLFALTLDEDGNPNNDPSLFDFNHLSDDMDNYIGILKKEFIDEYGEVNAIPTKDKNESEETGENEEADENENYDENNEDADNSCDDTSASCLLSINSSHLNDELEELTEQKNEFEEATQEYNKHLYYSDNTEAYNKLVDSSKDILTIGGSTFATLGYSYEVLPELRLFTDINSGITYNQNLLYLVGKDLQNSNVKINGNEYIIPVNIKKLTVSGFIDFGAGIKFKGLKLRAHGGYGKTLAGIQLGYEF